MNAGEARVAAAVVLSGLDGMTHVRLRTLLRRHEPEEALAVVIGDVADEVFTDLLRDRSESLPRRWRDALERTPPHELLARCAEVGVGVLLWETPGYPECLVDDPEAPAVLFFRGGLDALDGRRVGIVGTRSATNTGRRIATELGEQLAANGVHVVSGLARGVDACAHRGALAVATTRPVGVVACGLDVVYPPEHRELWQRVAERGLLLSERPPGSAPIAIAFPARNRILAALSEVVVVVESRASGGSLITAREAMDRDITVMAVPGSLSSRASEGTNELLRLPHVAPVLDAQDVLLALGLDTRRAVKRRRFDARPALEREDRELFDLIGGDAVTLEELSLRSCRELVAVAMSLGRMEAAGWVVRSGGWFEALPPGGK